MLSRRGFLKLGALGLAAGAVGAAGVSAAHCTGDIKLEQHNIRNPRLPSAFDGYRIGFLTDIHLGRLLPTEWLLQAVDMLGRSRIDLLLLGGDYIWLPEPDPITMLSSARNPEFANAIGKSGAAAIFAKVAEVVGVLRPKDGCFAVLGNHDMWTGPAACVASLERSAVVTLRNTSKTIERGNHKLAIIGVEDYWTGIPALPPIARRPSPDEFRILLSHNPDFTSEVLNRGSIFFDLCLGGHTHGGQIRLPLLGPVYCNVEATELTMGFFRHGDCLSYTSRGLGVVEFPYRLNCPPEVTIFELRRA